MGNCLKTQLKKVVNNDNILKIGEVIIDVVAETGGHITMSSYTTHSVDVEILSEGVSITAVDGDGILINSKKATLPNDTQPSAYADKGFTTSASQGDVIKCKIQNKYNIKVIKNLKYSNLSNLSYFTDLRGLVVSSYYTRGDGDMIENLINTENLIYLDLSVCNNLGGDIKHLGKMTRLTFINITNNKNITGSVESFVAAQRASGRTTASGITCNYNLGRNVTFNGAEVTGENNKSLSWTENTITFNGVTINA